MIVKMVSNEAFDENKLKLIAKYENAIRYFKKIPTSFKKCTVWKLIKEYEKELLNNYGIATNTMPTNCFRGY